MKIGIIGAGFIGGALTRSLTRLGHTVYVANSRGPETLKDLAEQTGAMAVTAKEAAHSGEVVIVTIPQKNIPDLPKDLFDGVGDDVVVIETGNYYPLLRDGKIPELEGTLTQSEWVQQQLGRPVVKVFNNILHNNIETKGKKEGEEGRIGLTVSGDNADHKRIVMQLVNELGFDPVDVGALRDSWKQQTGSPIYVAELSAEEIKAHLEKLGTEFTDTIRREFAANHQKMEEQIRTRMQNH